MAVKYTTTSTDVEEPAPLPSTGPSSDNLQASGECLPEEKINADPQRVTGVKLHYSLQYRLFKTTFMVLGPVALGIFLELAGPTLQDLMYRVDANYEEISRVLVARSAGYFTGSLLSGFLADKYADHVELWLSMAFFVASVGTFLIPWMRSLWLMGVWFHLQGVGQGTIDTNNNVLCVRLWTDKAAAPLAAIHFGFGIGAMLASQIARPWISETKTNFTNGTFNKTFLPTGRIEIPYSISGILSLVVCTSFFCFYVYDRYHGPKRTSKPTLADVKRIFSPGACAGGRMGFGIQIFLLVFLFFFNVVGGEWAFSKFLYSFATETGRFSRDSASTLNTVFWGCFTSGRGVAIFAARWIQPKYLIPVELIGNVLCGIVLTTSGYDVPLVLWIFTAIFGVVLAPVFPAGFAWINLHVHMTGMGVALIFIGSATGGMTIPWLTGYLFQYYGPRTLMYVILGYALFISCIYSLMCLLVWITNQYKYKPEARLKSKELQNLP